MRKKKLLLIFWIFVLMVAVGSEAILLKNVFYHMNQKVKIDEYGMEISYPKNYIAIEKEQSDIDKINSAITITATETLHEGNGVPFEFSEELIHAMSESSMITMLVQGIKTAKTEKTIEDICKDYITTFKIYNQSSDILDSQYKEVEINGVKAGRVEIYVIGQRDGVFPGVITYLFPLDDREITLTFTGTKEIFAHGKEEISNIVNSIHFNELEKSEKN